MGQMDICCIPAPMLLLAKAMSPLGGPEKHLVGSYQPCSGRPGE